MYIYKITRKGFVYIKLKKKEVIFNKYSNTEEKRYTIF